MFRYVAVVSDIYGGGRSEALQIVRRQLQAMSPAWDHVFGKYGLDIFCADTRIGSLEPHFLANESGVVLGTLFKRNEHIEDETTPSKAVLGEVESNHIIQTRGRELTESYWGNYVAFLNDHASRKCWIVKDPTGPLPCMRTNLRDATVFFSCPADCVDMGLKFNINWSCVKNRAISAQQYADDHPFHDVSEVYRGECIEINRAASPPQASSSFYWTPLSFSRLDEPVEDVEKATRALRATVIACTRAWASCHQNILLQISGGLDSSIILGCLVNTPTNLRITGWTNVMPEGPADPRPWARLMAEFAGCERIEVFDDPKAIRLRDLDGLMPSFISRDGVAHIVHGPVRRRLANEREASAVFSGEGGDNVFGSRVRFAVDDYLDRHGLLPESFRLALRVAVHHEQLVWKVLGASVYRWLRGHRFSDTWNTLQSSYAFVHPKLQGIQREWKQYPHPWFRQSKRVPWNTVMKLGMLASSPDFYDRSTTANAWAPEEIYPLYSQPLVELVLRIPMYTLFADGRDRGLARRAFVREVPAQILRRQWKDRSPGYFEGIVHKNLRFIRETLLDGELVRKQFLDPLALDRALGGDIARGEFHISSIVQHVNLECWVRRWTEQRSSATLD